MPETENLPSCRALYAWRTTGAIRDINPLSKLSNLECVLLNNTGDRYYVRHVPSDGSQQIIGYTTTDPCQKVVRMADLLELDTPPSPKRTRNLTPPPSKRPRSETTIDTTLFQSLAQLERTFRTDANRRRLLEPIPITDPSPFGLALMGSTVFEPFFQTYRTLFADRRAAFHHTAGCIREDLPALSLAEIKTLEHECQQLWRVVHTEMLNRHDMCEIHQDEPSSRFC